MLPQITSASILIVSQKFHTADEVAHIYFMKSFVTCNFL
jgi:hypothetical protein